MKFQAKMSPFQESFDSEDILDDDLGINVAKKNSNDINIVGLLTQVAETHDLQSVQSIKLKIMTKDLPLHSIHRYLLGLKELDLECSNVNSLRELGSDLRSLQVLRLGRCRLESLDGILAFRNLKEFSAPHNYIKHLGLAGQLPHIIYFDISWNFIDSWNELSFFNGASSLEELNFEGNSGASDEHYRRNVENILPQLVILDGVQIEGRNPRKTSPVLRAPEQPTKSRRTKKLLLNDDLCGNLTAALSHKKRQKSMEKHVEGNRLEKNGKLSEPEAMLKAAEMWKEAFEKYLKEKVNSHE